MNAYRSHDFSAIHQAILEAEAAGTPRADSHGRPYNAAGLLWSHYIGSLEGSFRSRADSEGGVDPDLSPLSLASRGINLRADSSWMTDRSGNRRADSSTMLAFDNVDRGVSVHLQPTAPNQLVAAIPTEPVTPWAESFTVEKVIEAGVAAPWRSGDSNTAKESTKVVDEFRPMMDFRFDVEDRLGAAERARVASTKAAALVASQARKMNNAVGAHLRAHNLLLRDGLDGFGGYSLRNIPGVHRVDSVSTFGTTGSDDALAEFQEILLKPTEDDASVPAPDTLLITRRLRNRLRGYFNFEAGGPGASIEAINQILSDAQISQVVICNELKDFGGAGVDGMVMFSRTDSMSLRQYVGLAPAPVKTYEHAGLSTMTAILSSSGGLFAPIANSVLVAKMKVKVG